MGGVFAGVFFRQGVQDFLVLGRQRFRLLAVFDDLDQLHDHVEELFGGPDIAIDGLGYEAFDHRPLFGDFAGLATFLDHYFLGELVLEIRLQVLGTLRTTLGIAGAAFPKAAVAGRFAIAWLMLPT